ncbi:MAG: restriction endonuclease subunit S [Magnetococcus sp. DMHC-1]
MIQVQTPQGWKQKPLKKVAEIERQGIQPDQISSDAHYVGLEHVDGEGNLIGVQNALSAELKSTKFSFSDQHILFGKLRPYLRKISRPEFSGICSTDILPIRPKNGLDRDYLFHYLRQQRLVDFATARCTGINLPRLSPKALAEFPVIYPDSLPEQKRIAAILDKADAIRRKRRQALSLADQFLRAVFLDMFGDPVTNPRGWPSLALGELLQSIESGWSPSCHEWKADEDSWGVLKLGSITQGAYCDSENKALPEGLTTKENLEIRQGDVLFNRKNTYALVGSCVYVHETRTKLMMSDLIFRLTPKPGSKLSKIYLWACLSHPGMRGKVQELASGAAGSMPNVSKARLMTLKIPRPDQLIQDRFGEIFARTINLGKNNDILVTESADLFGSLIQHAFQGGL